EPVLIGSWPRFVSLARQLQQPLRGTIGKRALRNWMDCAVSLLCWFCFFISPLSTAFCVSLLLCSRQVGGVEDPVIGVTIRTRVGLEVYGTNTELEKVKTGARAAGDRLRVDFQFPCELCPGEYTLTAASHDPD